MLVRTLAPTTVVGNTHLRMSITLAADLKHCSYAYNEKEETWWTTDASGYRYTVAIESNNPILPILNRMKEEFLTTLDIKMVVRDRTTINVMGRIFYRINVGINGGDIKVYLYDDIKNEWWEGNGRCYYQTQVIDVSMLSRLDRLQKLFPSIEKE